MSLLRKLTKNFLDPRLAVLNQINNCYSNNTGTLSLIPILSQFIQGIKEGECNTTFARVEDLKVNFIFKSQLNLNRI